MKLDMIDLGDRYIKYSIPYLKDFLGTDNIHEIPCIEKVTVSAAVNAEFNSDKKILDSFFRVMVLITGANVMMTKAKKAISNFKLRANQPVGFYTTLRGVKCYNFLSKFIYGVLPRIPNFYGLLAKSIDKHGNLSIGVKNVRVFNEIDYDDVVKEFGLNISVTIKNCKTRDGAIALFESLNFPIRK